MDLGFWMVGWATSWMGLLRHGWNARNVRDYYSGGLRHNDELTHLIIRLITKQKDVRLTE